MTSGYGMTGFGMTGFGKDPTNPFTNSILLPNGNSGPDVQQ